MAAVGDVAHLLRRAGFGATLPEVQVLAANSLDDIVAGLVDPVIAPDDPRPDFFDSPDVGDWEYEYRLQQWWLDRMATHPKPLQEKMTLFWHGHFCSQNEKVGDMKLMWDQHTLFRHSGMGDFRQLVHDMSLQPAMLLYLDGAYNTAGDANENFARELMELFTLGVGNYTQADIIASARAWTGYNVDDNDRTQFHYYNARHDHGQKTFMGVTQDWNGPDIIDYFLATNATKKAVAAKYIVRKLWTFFAYPDPPQANVDALAQVFLDNDLEIAPVLTALFLHPDFYSDTAKLGLVRTPAEFVAATLKFTGLTADDASPQWFMDDMGQNLFEPPNVAGWKNNGYWLGTSSMWRRADWAAYVAWRIYSHNQQAGATNVVQDAAMSILQGSAPSRYADAVDFILTMFGVFTPSDNTRRQLVAAATRQWNSHGWDERTWWNLVVLVMLSPEYNLS